MNSASFDLNVFRGAIQRARDYHDLAHSGVGGGAGERMTVAN